METYKDMGDDELIKQSVTYLSDLGIINNMEMFQDKQLISIGGTVVYTPWALRQKTEEIKQYWLQFSERFDFVSFDEIYKSERVMDKQWNQLSQAKSMAQKWAKDPSNILAILEMETHKYPGSGKTTLAKCIATYLIQTGVPVVFWRVPNIAQAWFSDGKNLPDYLTKAFSQYDDFKSGVIKVGQNCPVLILDDFGLQYQSEFMDYFFEVVISDRCDKGKPLVVTSPFSLKTIGAQYPFLHSKFTANTIMLGTENHYNYRADMIK